VPRWQYGAVVAVCAAALFGGAVYALSTEEEERVVEGSPTPVAGGTPGAVTPGATPTGPDGGGPLELVLGDNFFSLDGEEEPTVNIAAGTATTIALTNDGTAVHNMQVAGASGEFAEDRCATGGPVPCSDPERIRGGQRGEIVIDLAAGTYAFRCDFHPTEMTGTLQVN
jgi:plastocyanin